MTSKRIHTKSRLGCKQCKRRRIKCDEIAPCCRNCFNKAIDCEYQSWKGACENMQLLTLAIYEEKELLNADSRTSLLRGSTPGTNSWVSVHTALASTRGFSLEDLGLLHYFTVHTSVAVGRQNDDTFRWVWQNEVPRLAQTNPFLMHAVLSCASADRAQSEGGATQIPDWNRARFHYDKSIAFFWEVFENICTENADALLCFCILVMLVTLCLSAHGSLEQYDPLETWIYSMQTIHRSISVLELVKKDLRLSIIGRCLVPSRKDEILHDVEGEVAEALEIIARLARKYNTMTNNVSAAGLADALGKLYRFYSLTYSRPQGWSWIFSWVVWLDTGFEPLVRESNPIALLIVAHWCVTPCNAPPRWYTGTWPQALLLSIAQRLQGTEWEEGMTWPLNATIDDQRLPSPT